MFFFNFFISVVCLFFALFTNFLCQVVLFHGRSVLWCPAGGLCGQKHCWLPQQWQGQLGGHPCPSSSRGQGHLCILQHLHTYSLTWSWTNIGWKILGWSSIQVQPFERQRHGWETPCWISVLRKERAFLCFYLIHTLASFSLERSHKLWLSPLNSLPVTLVEAVLLTFYWCLSSSMVLI